MTDFYLLPGKDKSGAPLRVPDPMTGEALPAAGAYKPRISYWLRRLRDKDVREGRPPSPPAPARPVKSAKSSAPPPADSD